MKDKILPSPEPGKDGFLLKVGLAEMLKGGVIMDVTNAEQAAISENAGAVAVMALERVPADIRREGGVARMASIRVIEEIMSTVTIPVMAKVRIGHFAEAEVLQELGVDFIDESEVLTPADEANHVYKHDFRVPFVCGATCLAEALRVPNFAAGGLATPADAALMMKLGAESVFVGSGIFKSSDPEVRARAIVRATTHFDDPAEVLAASRELGEAMPGLEMAQIAKEELLHTRGW